MNRSELTKRLMVDTGLNQTQARACIRSLEEAINETLGMGGVVRWGGFLGSFRVVDAKAKVGRNFITGSPVPIPKLLRVKFIPTKRMKWGLNKK